MGSRPGDEARYLFDHLGMPISSHNIGGAIIKVYRAKDLYNPKWNGKSSRDAVLTLRRMSNRPYGRPLNDKYDAKSAIYIASATYPLKVESEHFYVREWLSARLVPGSGEPSGTGELEIFNCRGENVNDLVKRELFHGDENFLDYLAASNRMCGCRPYFLSKADEKRFPPNALPVKIQNTALLYALINKHFVNDYLAHSGVKYITGVIIDQLVDRALNFDIGSERYGTRFVYAHEMLGVGPSDIKLNRDINSHYAYRYSTYFLNAKQLFEWFDDLIHRGLLQQDSIEHYLGTKLSFSDMAKDPHHHLDYFRNISRLFLTKGWIYHSKITGAQLRELADKEVEDGPKLRITPISEMMSSIESFLEFLDKE